MKTIQQLAGEFSGMFETATRTTGKEYLRVKDSITCNNDYYINNPLYKLIYTAHVDLPPDNYKYLFIFQSLKAIAECEGDPNDIFMEAHVTNHDLLTWLASNNIRESYCDEILMDIPGRELQKIGIMSIVECAQLREKEQVFRSVFNSLNQILEKTNAV